MSSLTDILTGYVAKEQAHWDLVRASRAALRYLEQLEESQEVPAEITAALDAALQALYPTRQ